MAFGNESIEFDLEVNGKPAKKSIEEVEKAQEDLDKTVTKTSRNITTNWKAIAVGAAAVAAGITAMMKSSIELERALFGLNKETRDWIRNASEQYGMSQQLIAGFVQTGAAAGMAGSDIENMIDQAIALGRAYPHESTESFIDNLVMLNRTGEAQGYIVDILEQKYGTIDLKTLSLEKKQLALAEAVKGVNEKFQDTNASEYDQTMQELANTATDLGDAFMTLAEESGVLWLMNKVMDAGASAALGYAMALNRVVYAAKSLAGSDLTDINASFDKLVAQSEKKTGDLFGTNADGDIDMGTIDVAGTAKPKISISKVATGGASSSAADKERSIALAANERFWDDYNATMMSGMEYELDALNKQFTEYNKYVEDKAALNEWYAAEQKRIQDEHDAQMMAYADMQQSITDDLTDGIIEFAETGKLAFDDFAKSLIQNLIAIQIQSSMTSLMGGAGGGGIMGMIGGMFAKGAAFDNGNVTAFASGGVVTSPTVFPMANGMGLMGEAGAEAVMPLTRTSGGDLGVKSTAPIINVNVQNYGNDEVQVQQNENGIEVIISQIAQSIQRGTGDIGSSIEQRYGIRKA